MSENKQVATIEERQLALDEQNSKTSGEKNFELLQRRAKAMAASSVVPSQFQNNPANCMIAVELAQRTGSSEIAIAQNMYVVQGKPTFSGTFVAGLIGSCGRFSNVKYDMKGEEGSMDRGCIAWAKDKETGERVDGVWVTMQMAKDEGWLKNPKWKSMPELMLRYRAAAFFGRLHISDVMAGMHTTEEMQDVNRSYSSEPTEKVLDINADLGLDVEVKAADEPPEKPEAIDGELVDDPFASPPENETSEEV
jgi:hypothetical protein